MVMQQDEIVEIPPNRIKYFGTTGRMLLPCPATIAALIQRIPQHKLITTDLLRKELTAQFDVEGTCPVTTQKALKAIASEPNDAVACWRVIKQSGELMTYFPGGIVEHAARLTEEGFNIDSSGKKPKVQHYKENLVHFD